MSGTSNTSIIQPLSIAECPIFPNNPNHCDVVIGIRRTTAALSIIGSLFMIGVIWLFRKYTVYSQRLILYLSISAFFDAIAYLMGGLRPDGPMCNFQAWWMTYFDWSVLLWVCCITFNLYLNVVKMVTKEKLEWLYLGLCFGFPLLMSCLPLIGDHYGPAGAWCWIEDDWRWRLGIWYGPLFIGIFILMIVYIYIICTLSRKASSWQGTYDPDTERMREMLKEDIKPLRLYPFIYLAISLCPLINRIQNAVHHEQYVFALMVLASLTAPLHGAINAIVFGMDRETFSRLTPSQIKMAIVSRTQERATPREYPVALYTQDSIPTSPKATDNSSPRFSHVSYSRLH